MKTTFKVALVLLGYVAALGLGLLVEDLHERFAPAWANQSSGMYAEGSAILFFEVSGVAALFPTLLALFFLRKAPWFWRGYSWAVLGLAATGPLMEIAGVTLNLLLPMEAVMKNVPVDLFLFLVIVRIFAVIFLAPFDFLSAIFSPDPQIRKRLFIAFGMECALGLFVALNLTIRHKFI